MDFVHGTLPVIESHTKGVAKLLAQYPEMIDAVNDKGETPLHAAAARAHSDVVALLLAVASPRVIDAVDRQGKTALHAAAGRGCGEIVTQLLAVMSPHAVDAVDDKGKTGLHAAAAWGLGDIITQLLAVMSPDAINAVCKDERENGDTALHCAAHTNTPHVDIVEKLLNVTRPDLITAMDSKGKNVFSFLVYDNQ